MMKIRGFNLFAQEPKEKPVRSEYAISQALRETPRWAVAKPIKREPWWRFWA